MEIKERLIQAASVLFVKHGYNVVTIKDILGIAKVSRGGFYHHFQSKEEIFKEAMNRYYLTDDFNSTTDGCNTFSDFIDKVVTATKETMYSLNDKVSLIEGDIDFSNAIKLRLEAINILDGFLEELEKVYLGTLHSYALLIDKLKSSGEIREEVNSNDVARDINIIIEGAVSAKIFMPKTWEDSHLKNILLNYYNSIKCN